MRSDRLPPRSDDAVLASVQAERDLYRTALEQIARNGMAGFVCANVAQMALRAGGRYALDAGASAEVKQHVQRARGHQITELSEALRLLAGAERNALDAEIDADMVRDALKEYERADTNAEPRLKRLLEAVGDHRRGIIETAELYEEADRARR